MLSVSGCGCVVYFSFSMVEKYLMAFRPPPHLGSACQPPAVVLCGDFNSTPDSAVYQLVVTGTCDRLHIDLTSDRHGLLSELNLGHHISLKSAYAVVGQNAKRTCRPNPPTHTDLSVHRCLCVYHVDLVIIPLLLWCPYICREYLQLLW